MKKIICFILVLALSVNTIQFVYADDNHGGSSGSFDYPGGLSQEQWEGLQDVQNQHDKINEFIQKFIFTPDLYNLGEEFQNILFGKDNASDDDKSAIDNAIDGNVKTDGNYYYITNNFFKTVNNQIQNSVHAQDGYYLIEPANEYSLPYIKIKYSIPQACYDSICEKTSNATFIYTYSDTAISYLESTDYLFIDKYYSGSSNYALYRYDSTTGSHNKYAGRVISWDYGKIKESDDHHIGLTNISLKSLVTKFTTKFTTYGYGTPLKIFYSLDDLINYLNKGRTYSPKFPEINIKIPVSYVNNNVTLPSIDFGDFTATGKSETEIQDYLDSVLKKYLDKLQTASSATPTPTPGFTDGEPTPTPTPGTGGGDFTDTTPTPTPGTGGGGTGGGGTGGGGTTVDMTDINNWLQKIYNWLVSFGKSQDALSEKITAYIKNNDGKLDDVIKSIDNIKIPASPDVNVDFTDTNVALKKIQDLITSFQKSHDSYAEKVVSYLEKNNGKLDDIITAIDALSKGNTETEANGCKYDFTALSQFFTETWNESDKKFDTMIELLEKNNEYQKSLVDLLGDIKKELMESFRKSQMTSSP